MPFRDDKFNQISKRAIEHGFDALGNEEQEYLSQSQLTYIQPADAPERVRIEGWARIKDSRRITVLSVRDKENSSKKAEDHEQSFGRLKLHIITADADHHGSVLLWTEDPRKYDKNPDDPDEDYLTAEVYVSQTKLPQFLQDVKLADSKPH